MGLNKYIELDNGIEASYWRVESVRVEAARVNAANECVCAIALYKDHAARELNKRPIMMKSYSWNGAESPFLDTSVVVSPIAAVYMKLKTLPEFVDATDL